MDLHQLEYVIAIADEKGISRAADKLHITQSTLSQFLGKLEGELGVRLFDRRRNEMVLTYAGQLYVDTCRQMLRERRELYNQMADLMESRTGSFSIGITPQWGAVAYAHIFQPFHQIYPRIRISVKEETAMPLIQMLQEGQVDMAVIHLTDNTALPLESILLHAEELLLAIPRAHADALHIPQTKNKLPSVEIELLAAEPMIFSQNGTTIRKLEEQCFSSKKISPNVAAEVNSHPASLILVEQGVGSTFVPVSCASPSDKIVFAHAVPTVQWFVVIAFRKGFVPRQSERHFIKLAKEYFNRISNSSPNTVLPSI